MADTAFVAITSYSATSNEDIVSKPAGTAENDIMFTFISCYHANEPSSVPSGWTKLGSNAASGWLELLYYKVAGASEPDTYTWGWADSTWSVINVATYRGGFNASNPIDVVSNTPYTVSNTTVQAASMNVSSVNSNLIFIGFLYTGASGSYTKPDEQDNDWIEDYDHYDANTAHIHTFDHCNWSGSGASGVINATASSTGTLKHAFAVALNIEEEEAAVNTMMIQSTLG